MEEIGVLRNVGNLAAPIGAFERRHRLAVHAYDALRGGGEPSEQVYQRRFSSARRPDYAHLFEAADGKRHVVQGFASLHRAIRLPLFVREANLRKRNFRLSRPGRDRGVGLCSWRRFRFRQPHERNQGVFAVERRMVVRREFSNRTEILRQDDEHDKGRK